MKSMQALGAPAIDPSGGGQVLDDRNAGASHDATSLPLEWTMLLFAARLKYAVPWAVTSSIATSIGPGWYIGSRK
jgi:hypothetical protein